MSSEANQIKASYIWKDSREITGMLKKATAKQFCIFHVEQSWVAVEEDKLKIIASQGLG